MVAKRFFYVCAGLLCLALAYHFGAVTATAQAPGNPVVGVAGDVVPSNFMAVTANGDCYKTPNFGVNWYPVTNVFSGGPTPATQPTWGQLKARYRPGRGRESA